MTKKLYTLIHLVLIILSFSALTSFAEEYMFSTTANFPLSRSSSIEVVNETHNVYTTQSLDDIQHLIDAGIVVNYEPVGYMELFDYTTNDTYYNYQTNLSSILAPFAWNKGIFGDDVKIAVIDSGICSSAEDFNFNNIIKAEDYTPSKSSPDTFCENEAKLDHGTMVTGIIAASHNNIGVAGIAPNVKVYVFKYSYYDYTIITDEDGKEKERGATGLTDNIVSAIYDAVDKYDCDIINISAGTKTDYYELRRAVNYAESKGVLIVAAAGNYGHYGGSTSTALYYPASYNSVISVGSADANGYRASHSQRNNKVNLIAPGMGIYSVCIKENTPDDGYTNDYDGYRTGSGTSFASPTVVAAAALAKALKPDLTPDEIRNALYTTADTMTDNIKTTEIDESLYTGAGMLNIQALLTYVRSMDSKDLIYSLSGDTAYMSYKLPTGYKSYFATYHDNMLTNVFSTDDSVFIKSDTAYLNAFKQYVWDMNTLRPYGIINKTEY